MTPLAVGTEVWINIGAGLAKGSGIVDKIGVSLVKEEPLYCIRDVCPQPGSDFDPHREKDSGELWVNMYEVEEIK